MYKISYLEDVVKIDIPKLDYAAKKLIKETIEKKLAHNPIEFGKPLQYSLKSCRRLRIGDYRVIYQVLHVNREVTVIYIRHRSVAYRGL